MTSQPGQQTITKHVLPNILSKRNQTMKFGQLIELNINFSWKIIHKIWWRNYFQTFFKKAETGSISGSIDCFIQFIFIICQVEGYWNVLKLSCKPLAFASYKAFFWKKGLELSSLAHFLYEFWRKMFPWWYSINWLKLIAWLLLLRDKLGNMCIVIAC